MSEFNRVVIDADWCIYGAGFSGEKRSIKAIEKPLSKYISYVWENISFEDYVSLIENNPNENILNHQIYKSYITKHTINKILEIEKEKFMGNFLH